MPGLGRRQVVGRGRIEQAAPAEATGRRDAALTEHIQSDGDQDDEPAGEGLIVGRDSNQRLALGENGDERRAEERSDQRAAAPEQARPADDDGRNDIELLSRAGFGGTCLQPRRENDPGQCGTEAADDISGQLDPWTPIRVRRAASSLPPSA